MNQTDLPILMVDNTKISQTIMLRAFQRANFHDIRHASNTTEAITALKERPANIVIADRITLTMSGNKLLNKIRLQDKRQHHFTYILMLHDQENAEISNTAFLPNDVDDFISKSDLASEFLPRLNNGVRLSYRLNQLLSEQRLLKEEKESLEQRAAIFPDSGMGNTKYAEHMIKVLLSHAIERGGVLCTAYFNLHTLRELRLNHTGEVMDALDQSFFRRLKQQTRTMDVLCDLQNDEVMLLSLRSGIDHTEASHFRRLYHKLTQKTHQTPAGFMNLPLSMSVLVFDPRNLAKPAEFTDILNTLRNMTTTNNERHIHYETWPRSA